jgi:hypothetical protein
MALESGNTFGCHAQTEMAFNTTGHTGQVERFEAGRATEEPAALLQECWDFKKHRHVAGER